MASIYYPELEKLLRTDNNNRNDKFLENLDNFCIYPYIQLDIRTYPDGKIHGSPLCCSANGFDQSAVIELKSETLEKDFYVESSFHEIRKNIRKNILPNNCIQQCPKTQKRTMRSIINDQYKQVIPFELVTKSPKLVMINWKFGNHCNLACRMCNSGSSSQFNKIIIATTLDEDKNNNNSIKFKLEKFGIGPIKEVDIVSTEDTTFKKLEKMLPELEHLKISGGEPFVSYDLDRLLKSAIKTKDCEHIEIDITTNGTKFIKEKLDLVSKFKYLKFTISIDGTDSIYNYIRYPFKFNILRKRLEYLAEYLKEHELDNRTEIAIVCMGMLYNLFEYAKLEKLYNDMVSDLDLRYSGFFMDPNLTGSFVLNKTINRYHILNLKFVPSYLIAEALEYYKDHKDKLWYTTLQHINETQQDTAYQPLIKEYTKIFDGMHNQTYQNFLHPSIIKFLD